MSSLIVQFHGAQDEFEYDLNPDTNTIMFHDIKTNTIFMGGGNFKCDVTPKRYNDFHGVAFVDSNPSADITIEFETYSIFKYNNNSHKDRFKIYWNEKQTVIWDTEEKRQVIDKDIWKYLIKLQKEEDEDELWYD